MFAGGSATRSLWKQLEPLRVLRVVADADEAKLQELGLAEGADPQGTLTLTIAGEAQVFALGDKAFGTADTFARAPDGRIVVLGSGLMKDLRIGAGRLMETALFESGRGDIDGLEVELADKGLAMRQHNPESRRQAFWSEPESDTPRGDFAAWVDKLLGLVAVDWLEVSAPQAGWEPVATVHVLRGASPYEKVRLFRATGDEGEPRWLALGDHGRLAAKLDRAAAEALVEDLGALVR